VTHHLSKSVGEKQWMRGMLEACSIKDAENLVMKVFILQFNNALVEHCNGRRGVI
jgi:hypothetical protein